MFTSHESTGAQAERFDTLASANSAVVGPYQLCMELASGGMAKVFLARARHGSRHSFVALKLMHPHLSEDRTFVEMFVDEAILASQIHHANVCEVFDFGYVAGQHYLAMEYIAGEPLGAIWRKLSQSASCAGPPPACLIAHALAGACEGLHSAHGLSDATGEPLNVVHRDVSPENILLTYDGVAKVVDFGVASASHQHHRTRTGILKGKIAYIAPEMLNGGKPDRRVDVWGVGATAWELLTGRRLFRTASDLETLRAIAEAQIVPPSELAPGVPRALDEVVLRALERDKDKRFQTTRELGQALLNATVRDGNVVGLAEVAEWMNLMFPTGRQRHRDRLEMVERATAPPPTLVVGRRIQGRIRSTGSDPSLDEPARSSSSLDRTLLRPSQSELPGRASTGHSRVARLRGWVPYAIVPAGTLLLGVMLGRSLIARPPAAPGLRAAGAIAAADDSRPRTPGVPAAEGQARAASTSADDRQSPPYLVRVEQVGDELILRVHGSSPGRVPRVKQGISEVPSTAAPEARDDPKTE